MYSESQLKDLKILLAEDNQVNQLLITKVIEKAGMSLRVVNNGIEALKALSENKFDLILMDVQMPEMNGIETTKEIIKTYKEDRPKIIAITAGSFEDDVQQCMDAGMDGTLHKPFRIDNLLDKLKEISL